MSTISNLWPWSLVLIVVAVLIVWIPLTIRVLPEYERAVIFRFGNVRLRPKGPGLIFVMPFGIDRLRKVNLQTIVTSLGPQDVITRDNVALRIEPVVYSRVVDPLRAVVEVQDYRLATAEAAQAMLHAILSKKTLNEMLSALEEINAELSAVLAGTTAPWGVRVTSVEIRHVERLEEQRAMSPEAERGDMEARSKLQWTYETQPVSSVPDVPDVPEDLVAALVKGQGVLFCGAGTAASAGWPTWWELLSSLLDRLGGEDPSWRAIQQRVRDPQVVGELVSGRLDRPELLRHLESILPRDRGHIELPALHRLLRQLPFAGVVTNNWDDLVERTFQDREPTLLLPTESSDFALLLREERFFLMRASGVLSDDELLFTGDDYRQVTYENRPFTRFVASLFTAKTVLFLGTSIDGMEEFLVGSGLLSRPDRTHYALVPQEPDTDLHQERLARRYNIRLLPYGPTRDFQEVVGFTRSLAAKVSSKMRGPTRSRPQREVLRDVRLQNIGPFEELTLSLHRGWNILLGDNGCGKSTLLEAIGLALVGDDDRARPAAERLLKVDERSGTIELRLGEDAYRTELVRDDGQVRIVSEQFTPVQSGLLLSLGFPTLRGVSRQNPRGPTSAATTSPVVNDLLPLLLGPVDERFDSLKQWIVNTALRSEDPDAAPQERSRYTELLGSLFGLLEQITPGVPFSFKRIDRTSWDVIISTEDGDISIDLVSQGMSSVIGWVGTLVQRLYEVYGEDERPEHKEALVLVDEIDAHLHPEWQAQIVPILRKVFPRLQVVATTHSPLIVGNLRPGELHYLRRDRGLGVVVEPIEQSFRGWRADQILTSPAFDMDSTRDEATKKLLQEYKELLARPEPTEPQRARLRELSKLLEDIVPSYEETETARRAEGLIEEWMLARLGDLSSDEQQKVLEEAQLYLARLQTGKL